MSDMTALHNFHSVLPYFPALRLSCENRTCRSLQHQLACRTSQRGPRYGLLPFLVKSISASTLVPTLLLTHAYHFSIFFNHFSAALKTHASNVASPSRPFTGADFHNDVHIIVQTSQICERIRPTASKAQYHRTLQLPRVASTLQGPQAVTMFVCNCQLSSIRGLLTRLPHYGRAIFD